MALREHEGRPIDEREEGTPTKAQWFATTHWSVVLTARQDSSPEYEVNCEASSDSLLIAVRKVPFFESKSALESDTNKEGSRCR
jgi:hypothetical protein